MTEIKEEIKISLEVNKNKNTTYPDSCDTMKMALTDKVAALNAYI